MNVTTRTTLLCLATAGAYTLFAYMCGAVLPPKPYVFCAAVLGVQAILCSNSSFIMRRLGGQEASKVDLMKIEVFFVLIVCFGSAYSMLAKLRVQDGVIKDTRNGHEVFLIIMVGMVELGWALIQPTSESRSSGIEADVRIDDETSVIRKVTMLDRYDLKRAMAKKAQQVKKK